MENLDITFLIDAEVKDLNKKLSNVNKDVVASQKELEQSVARIVKHSQKYPDGFTKSLKVAESLKAELDKIAKQKTPFTQEQQMVVGAGFKQFGYQQRKDASAIIKKEADAEKAAAKAQAEHHANLVKARYALYDVSAEARRMGLVMTGIGLASVKVAADFERAFVDVARTTDLAGTELEAMRQGLLDISQTTPIAFSEIAKIATLGAQMNVANENLAQFSETVAKFGAVTGVSVDESAAAFGRLDQQFDGVQGNYEKLGSSILYAGRNAIATEAEITTLTTQISAAASQAGYTAEQTIGLATALASLKIAPEQARGVILRLFGDFDRIVAEGGTRLKDFATLMGITSAEAANLWKTDAPEFMNQFTAALKNSAGSAEDMNVKLNALGIVETREINVLQRLATNHDVLTRSMNDATGAYAEGTDLANQYGQVAATLTERINKLVNNILAFAAEAGKLWAQLLGPIVDLLSGLLDAVTANPVLTFLASLGVAVAGLSGIFLLYQASLYQAAAGVLALRTTMAELVTINGTASVSLGTLISMIRGSGLAAGDAALSTNLYSVAVNGMTAAAARAKGALIALGTVMKQNIIFLAASLAAWAAYESVSGAINDFQTEISESIAETSNNLKLQAKEIAGLQKIARSDIFGNLIGQTSDLEEAFASAKRTGESLFWGFQGAESIAKANPTIKALDENLKALAEGGNAARAAELFEEIKSQAEAQDFSVQELSEIFPEYSKALRSISPDLTNMTDEQLAAAEAGVELSDIIKERLTGSVTKSQNAFATYAGNLKTFMADLNASGGSINAWSETGSKALSSFSSLLDTIIQQSGTDMKGALTQTAAALALIESKGGDAGSQVDGLVERINSLYGIQLDPATINSMAQLQAAIAGVGNISEETRADILALASGGEYASVYQEIFTAIADAAKDGGDAVKREVTSVFDYASSLGSLFGDIIDQTYRLTVAQDEYSNGWDDTSAAVKKAKAEVADLKLEVLNLKSSGKDLENQLSIAKAYGDADQIKKIQAEIAANNQKIAKSEQDIADAQAARSMSLKGGSEAARQNRAEVRARVEDAKNLVAAYASTAKANGKLPSQTEIRAYSNTVANQFKEQAVAVGFSSSEIAQYLETIRGFGQAASSVDAPTIDVVLNPIDTAIKAYLEKKKTAKVDIKPTDDGLAAKIQAIFDRVKPKVTILGTIAPDAEAYKKLRDASIKGLPMWAHYDRLYQQAKNNAVPGASLLFASGGLVTGPGTPTSDSIPAMLSNGEYVINASAVKEYGVDFLNSINQQRGIPIASAPSTASAGSSSQVVYLSTQDRELLKAAVNRPVTLYTSDKLIATSANNGNRQLARRGVTN